MGSLVVYVHGIGNQVRSESLKRRWDKALFGRDLGSASRMAYWTHLRYQRPLPDEESDAAESLPITPLDAAAPAAPPISLATETPQEFIAHTMAEAQASILAGPEPESAAEAADPTQIARLEGWLTRMTYAADALAAGESAMPRSDLKALLVPAPVRQAAFRAFVKVALKDVYAYFFGGLKDRIQQCLRTALDGASGPAVVVGHSLGSVIAYDVLRSQNPPSLGIPLFFTLGSPLAVTEIKDLVTRPLEVPARVAAWHNASDARDLVALDHTLRPEYVPAEKCKDFIVVNNSSSHHGISEYLRAPLVQQAVGAALAL